LAQVGADRFMKHSVFCATVLSLVLLTGSMVVTLVWPRWRVWPPPSRSSWQYWYTWALATLALLGTTLLGIVDWNTFGLPLWLRGAGGLLAVAGSGFALWGVRELGVRATQGLGGDLVATGPYPYSRNPQYVGDIALLLGFGIFCNSALTLAAGALGAVWYALAPFAEEPWLRERLGSPYEEYCRRAPRFLGWPADRRNTD